MTSQRITSNPTTSPYSFKHISPLKSPGVWGVGLDEEGEEHKNVRSFNMRVAKELNKKTMCDFCRREIPSKEEFIWTPKGEAICFVCVQDMLSAIPIKRVDEIIQNYISRTAAEEL